MKLSIVVCLVFMTGLVCVSSAEASPRDKRFFIEDVDKIIHKAEGGVVHEYNVVKDKITGQVKVIIQGINVDLKTVGDFTNNAQKQVYDTAQNTFNNVKGVVGKVNFRVAVVKLIPFINSGMSEDACELACEKGGDEIFSPVGTIAAAVACPSVCQAALAQLQDLAEEAEKNHS